MNTTNRHTHNRNVNFLNMAIERARAAGIGQPGVYICLVAPRPAPLARRPPPLGNPKTRGPAGFLTEIEKQGFHLSVLRLHSANLRPTSADRRRPRAARRRAVSAGLVQIGRRIVIENYFFFIIFQRTGIMLIAIDCEHSAIAY